jgi:endonuclease IV
MQIGLKLGSKDIKYTQEVFSFYEQGIFQYIELFAISGTYDATITYWKQFSIPVVIHAPHSMAGMNLSWKEDRKPNEQKLHETFHFGDNLNAEHIIFHSGVDGNIEETVHQLRPYADSRCLIENKPVKGLKGEKCIGSTPEELQIITKELSVGFCLDFGHAICAANSLKKEPLSYISNFLDLQPIMYHLTDGDYTSEHDSHLHYGEGSFPIKKILEFIPNNAKLTNEAKHDSVSNLNDFQRDISYIKACVV